MSKNQDMENMTITNTLLNPPSRKEADRRAYIRSWLHTIKIPEYSIRAEYHTDVGSIDLYLTNRRVIIEVKKDGRLSNGPHELGTGSFHNETAFEQLTRYVKAESAREHLYLDEDVNDLNWIGVVTDGRVWYVWTWYAKVVHDDSESKQEWNAVVLNPQKLKELSKMFDREPVGKEWATSDMSYIFEDIKKDLMELYNKNKVLRNVKTQKSLWFEQLKGGGNAPKSDEDEIFVIHTMLILIVRAASHTNVSHKDDFITEGFVNWVNKSMVKKIIELTERYNWRQQTGDILRALYEHYIPTEHRKTYGEYYTPDWLAELICSKVIDDEFITEQIRRYNSNESVYGILDPSCGSGTFLYHATKRIMSSHPVEKTGMNERKITDFICRMIKGIDIHPVAVEMARANMHRLLPKAEDQDVVIYQGDSLLTNRPDAQLFGDQGKNLPLRSPEQRLLVMPGWFLGSPSDIDEFVTSACKDSELSPGLGASSEKYDLEQLQNAHNQLRDIVRNESDGVWKWYIMNQAGPMNMVKTIGRIVSNPPWVRLNTIHDIERKKEIEIMAKERKLWVGGNVATSFDVATLFVDRCSSLYMRGKSKSGWVLPQAAMIGGSWESLREKKIHSGAWDLKRIPFKNTPTCVMFYDVDVARKNLEKKPRVKLNHNDSWETASAKTSWVDPPPSFPIEISKWVDRNKKPNARMGATVVPHCLTWVKNLKIKNNDMAHISTKPSMHDPWKSIGTLEGNIPLKWIIDCISFNDLFPYVIPTSTKCIMPFLDSGIWDPKRVNNRFWQNLSDQYEAHCSQGNATSKTLEGQLNYQGKLFSQFGRTGEYVAYNSSGDILHAARMTNIKYIVHTDLFYVSCRSKNEALFLIGILNSDAMLPAFKGARQSDRHFVTHIWKKIPIPRYDNTNQWHKKLITLTQKAEKISKNTYEPNTPKIRERIREVLRDDGVSSEIDDVCKKLMPKYTL